MRRAPRLRPLRCPNKFPTVSIGAALKEAGITIPFPQRDLHLKSIKPEALMAMGVSQEDGGKPENH